MYNLANLYQGQGRYDEAESLHLQTLELRKRVLGEEHPDTLMSADNLAMIYGAQGRYDEAEPLNLEALEIFKRVLGEEHPHTVASMNNLAELYENQGRYNEAEPLVLEALEIRKRVLGEEHPDTLALMNWLAWLYHQQGRYDEAEPLYLQALERRRRVSGLSHRETNRVRINLINLYRLLDRPEDARPFAAERIGILCQAAERPDAGANGLNAVAWELLTVEPADLRDPAAAMPFAIRANDMTNHESPAYLDTLSLAYHLTGDTAKAIENQKKAIALLPPGESSLRTSLEGALADFESALKEFPKLPTPQEAVAKD